MSAVVPEVEVPASEDVLAVTEDVWMALLGDDAPLLPRTVAPGAPFDVAAWSAATTISGGWQGVVTVELDEALARRLTMRMLALPADEQASDSDVADAVGELVNMVGGNVKSLMPGPSVLSLPAVAAGRAAFSSDSALACRVDLVWQDAPVRVSVHVPQEGPR
ncbi:chemotaxis protein CheX [Nocardioides daeguensis]|uniref:Chemotaxis phosphatase CheX-like domain-containing protein n=1 Tax=Nocardioides daeguensis TaxID=908359 RepID=A0ABP6V9B8_9ACTN|nr:chemotaxis protein CheX [Nocardioides daeguensis]MBV6726115.1 chemotaxis protein CheX [Nocardioides daeguensis]MCR1771958.1 chemotaxis protein CheX [Nocardioides daeguensis]